MINEEILKKFVFRRRVVVKTVCLIALIAVVVILALLQLSVAACEWYARTISRGLVTASSAMTRWLPFSVFELLIYLAVALGITFLTFIIVNCVRKNYRKAINAFVNLLIVIMSVITLYSLCVLPLYNRAPADIPMSETQTLEKEKSERMVRTFIDELNALAAVQKRDSEGKLIMPYSFDEMADSLQKTYERVIVSDYFTDIESSVKKWLWPDLMAAFSISGVFFAPTGECNVCTSYYPTVTVSSAAHEMAHSRGVMRESDANLVSYYVMLNSDDPFIRYIGYYSVLYDILDFAVFELGEEVYEEIIDSISQYCDKDADYELESVREHGEFYEIGNFFNNLYLKISGLEDGVNNYYPPNEDIIEVIPPPDGSDEPPQVIVRREYNDRTKMLIGMFYPA